MFTSPYGVAVVPRCMKFFWSPKFLAFYICLRLLITQHREGWNSNTVQHSTSRFEMELCDRLIAIQEKWHVTPLGTGRMDSHFELVDAPAKHIGFL